MKTPEEIFNSHSWAAIGAISPSKDFCIAAMKEYKAQSEWIAVTDRLPEEEKEVMVYTPKPYGEGFNFAFYTGRKFQDKPVFDNADWFNESTHITHWMPLPEPPQTVTTTHEDVNTEPK